MIAIGGVTIGLLLSLYLSLKFSIPQNKGDVQLPGLTGEVSIKFDAMGIPQIMATNEQDLYFALGYQHAADRLFQMDITRRLASGNLSELFGELGEELDKDQKRIGHRRLARQGMNNLSEVNRQRLQAYADGINRYVETCGSLPFEYRFLPAEFTPWTVEDCLTLLSFQTWYSNSLMSRDRFYARLSEKFPEDKVRSLIFTYPEWGLYTVNEQTTSSLPGALPTIPGSRLPSSVRAAKPDIAFSYRDEIFNRMFTDNRLPFIMTEASNAWVVAPEKSESGYPLLASDPHLDVSRLPQFWYAAGLHTDTSHLFGITTPGLPFVAMGYNGTAGWAFTAGGTDLTDYYSVELNPENNNQYKTENGWLDFNEVKDTIFSLSNDEPLEVTYYTTDKTVLINRDDSTNKAILLYWVGFDTDLDDAINNAFALHSVSSLQQFRNVVTSLGALDANYMYADVNGAIGYQLSAPLLKRTRTGSSYPHTTPDFDANREFYPADLTPHSENPADGYLASCNNRPSRTENYTGQYFTNRILRINELLQSKNIYNADDMKTFQQDLTNTYMMRFREEIAAVLKNINQPGYADTILNWTGGTGTGETAPVIMNLYLTILKKMTFEDELEDIYRDLPNRWIENLEQITQAGWFDDITTEGTKETYDDISRKAMTKAIEVGAGKTWGEVHTIQMQHPMAIIPIINSLLDLTSEEEPWRGAKGTINASFFVGNETTGFHCLAAPSMRLVIDFANPTEASFVLPAGNSGNPMTDHFFDFYPLWKEGKYWDISIDPETINSRTTSTLILKPL